MTTWSTRRCRCQVEASNTGAGFDDDESIVTDKSGDESIATNNSDGDDEAPADKTES